MVNILFDKDCIYQIFKNTNIEQNLLLFFIIPINFKHNCIITMWVKDTYLRLQICLIETEYLEIQRRNVTKLVLAN